MKLQKIFLRGYKSIDNEGQTIDLGNITVLIGANGSGKSNFLSLFSTLNHMLTGNLQNYIAARGFADSFLHMGSEATRRFDAEFFLSDEKNEDVYRFTLAHSTGGAMSFVREEVEWHRTGAGSPFVKLLGNGHKESELAAHDDKTCSVVFHNLARIRMFHFHNTELTAKIRNNGYIEDDRYLRSDAGNLAAFLYAMQKNENRYYRRITDHVREIFPQFRDFDLKPSSANERYIGLNWRAEGSDLLWGPHQISDGSLRFMALVTLLLQPPERMPNVVVLDEPELGLHPSAILKLAALLKSVSYKTQIIVATQSAMLLNEMDPGDVCVVEFDRHKQSSEYRRVDADALANWLEDYTLSQLWEKNVLGGKP